MTPQGLPDAEYLLCAEKVFQSFNKVTSHIDSIKSLPGNEFCPEMTMEMLSASQESLEFVCSINAMAAILNSNTHICRNVICCISRCVYINNAHYFIWYTSMSHSVPGCIVIPRNRCSVLLCIFISVCFPMNDIDDIYVY